MTDLEKFKLLNASPSIDVKLFDGKLVFVRPDTGADLLTVDPVAVDTWDSRIEVLEEICTTIGA